MRISQLHVTRIGDRGLPLVMLHGWGRDSTSLRGLAEVLKPHFSIYLIDLPGFGKSPRPEEAWSPWEYGQFLKDYLDHKGLERCQLFGHSFGGKIASCMALRFPRQIERVTLVAPSAVKPRRGWVGSCRMLVLRAVRKILRTADSVAGSRFYQKYYVPRFASKDYLAAGALRETLVKAVSTDLEPFLSQLSCPIQLIWGDKDQETPVDMAYRMQCQVPQLQLTVIPHKGHEPFANLGAHLVGTLMLDFLKKEPT